MAMAWFLPKEDAGAAVEEAAVAAAPLR